MASTAAFTELCPGCFAEKGTASLCPQCGYDESLKRGPLVLAHRTLLHHGQYLIGRVLGKPGGFGITYLALDTKLETRVGIKEYLPRDLAGRDAGHATISAHSAEDGEFFRYGLTQFLQEARTLAQFDHANIVRVRNFFEENGTGYLVMDYYDGVTLADYLAQQPQGRLPEKTAVGILMPILDGLREVHAKNFLHRDIKPQNIYLTTGNRPILLDFGAARQAMGERSRSLSVVLSEGYAPYEQYHRRGEQGPWTDIYACAAVLYHAVAGEAPPPATERVHKDELDIAALELSASLTNALRLGLAADHHHRPQRMTEFQALLLGNGELKEMDEAEQNPGKIKPTAPAKIVGPNPIEPTKGKGPSFLTMLFRLALAVVIVIGVLVAFMSEEKKAVQTAATPLPIVAEAEMKSTAAVGGQHAKGGLVSYKEEKYANGKYPNGEYIIRTRLVATFGDKRVIGPDAHSLDIKTVKDFSGDGVMDALISTWEGGNAFPPEYAFVSVSDGKIVTAPVKISEGFTIVEEGSRYLVKSESDLATEYWGFDGHKAIKVRSTPKHEQKIKGTKNSRYGPVTIIDIPGGNELLFRGKRVGADRYQFLSFGDLYAIRELDIVALTEMECGASGRVCSDLNLLLVIKPGGQVRVISGDEIDLTKPEIAYGKVVGDLNSKR